MAVEQVKSNDWFTIKRTADSGAVDIVEPEHVARSVMTVPNSASRSGMHYVAANGTPIYNQGENIIIGRAEHGMNVSIAMQVADVSKALASTANVCDAGNIQAFTN